MDKRYKPIPLAQQLLMRKEAVEALHAHPEWSLLDAIRHLKKPLRLTTTELAKLAGIAMRTLQDIEQGRSQGTVQTMNRVFGVVGLRLGVVRGSAGVPLPPPANQQSKLP